MNERELEALIEGAESDRVEFKQSLAEIDKIISTLCAFANDLPAYEKWIARIPGEYQESVLDESPESNRTVAGDPNCLALLKHYRSLMPMAQEARKPIFHLKPADGAIGAHGSAVQAAGRDFRELAEAIAQATGLPNFSSKREES